MGFFIFLKGKTEATEMLLCDTDGCKCEVRKCSQVIVKKMLQQHEQRGGEERKRKDWVKDRTCERRRSSSELVQQVDHAGWCMHNYLEGVKVRLCWCRLFKLCV